MPWEDEPITSYVGALEVWAEQAHDITTSAGSGTALSLTDDQAALMAARLRDVRLACDHAEALIRSHVESGGQCIVEGKTYCPTECAGRQTASVKDLLAHGLEKYVRMGKPSVRWMWKKAGTETTEEE